MRVLASNRPNREWGTAEPTGAHDDDAKDRRRERPTTRPDPRVSESCLPLAFFESRAFSRFEIGPPRSVDFRFSSIFFGVHTPACAEGFFCVRASRID